MTEARSLHHTGFTVSDLGRSLAFYRDQLGFEVVFEQEKRGGYLATIVGYPDAHVRMAHLRLPGSDHRLELFEYVSPEMTRDDTEPRRIGPTHVCIVVDDLARMYERLRGREDVAFFSAPVEVDTGVNRGSSALYLRDPDGIILELYQPPPA